MTKIETLDTKKVESKNILEIGYIRELDGIEYRINLTPIVSIENPKGIARLLRKKLLEIVTLISDWIEDETNDSLTTDEMKGN